MYSTPNGQERKITNGFLHVNATRDLFFDTTKQQYKYIIRTRINKIFFVWNDDNNNKKLSTVALSCYNCLSLVFFFYLGSPNCASGKVSNQFESVQVLKRKQTAANKCNEVTPRCRCNYHEVMRRYE